MENEGGVDDDMVDLLIATHKTNMTFGDFHVFFKAIWFPLEHHHTTLYRNARDVRAQTYVHKHE